MKSLLCSGCGHKVMGTTEQEVMDTMMSHMKEAHPEDVQKMMEAPKEEQDKMMEESRKMIQDEEGM